jgi:alginate O-acetyltransferase complex protein AlgI
MLFDTPIFFCFLCVVVAAYWCLDFRSQNRFLLVASYFFYGWWDWRFLCLMIASTIIDYFIAIKIADTKNPRLRRSLYIVNVYYDRLPRRARLSNTDCLLRYSRT